MTLYYQFYLFFLQREQPTQYYRLNQQWPILSTSSAGRLTMAGVYIAQCYFNQKMFYSIQLQAMCDHQCQFLDIFVGYPGSVHDSRVPKNSPLYVQSLCPPEG